MKKFCCLAIVFVMLVSLMSINVFAQSPVRIYVESVNVAADEEIIVPVKVENNTGICGATLTITCDDALSLKSISSGDAWTSLILTKPGDLTANPFNLVFDGMEQDSTNGTIVYLCFNPVSQSGTYNLSVSYEDGDIVDGNLSPVEAEVEGGSVTVGTNSGGGDNEEDDNDEPEHQGTVITIGNVVTKPNQTVDVPVYVSGNTGMCGVTLKITYNEALSLTGITKGDSLPGLLMTKPGNMIANPFNLVFDGIEEDTTNGLFFTLTFTVPSSDGEYEISATYEEGDIVDGDLLPVDVLIKNGKISSSADNYEISIGDEKVIVQNKNVTSGKLYVAFYKNERTMISATDCDLSNKSIDVDIEPDASYAKVFYWTDKLKPLCDEINIILK